MGSMWIDPLEDEHIYPGQPEDVPQFDEHQMTSATKFPNKRWGADFQSLLWLVDFTTNAPNWTVAVRDKIVLPPRPTSQSMKDGIKDLVVLQQQRRKDAMAEILAQNTDFQLYFCSQLGIYPRTYPKSYLMMKGAARIGELVMVYLKRTYSGYEPRPSQIYPRLTPPVAVPPHSSFPSGHALISHLMALVAEDVVPGLKDPAYKLAVRIRQNREIAGLHYYWDGAAGEVAAKNTYGLIKGLSSYKDLVGGAHNEWMDS